MSRFDLLLMRHGHAEDWADGGDAERALTREGAERISRVGRLVAAMGLRPAVAVASPLRRAQQTARLMLEACAPELELTTEPMLVPSGPPSSTIERLAAQAPTQGGLLLAVGHNPSITSLLGQLVCGDAGMHFAVAPGDFGHLTVEATSKGTRGVLRAFVPSAIADHML